MLTLLLILLAIAVATTAMMAAKNRSLRKSNKFYIRLYEDERSDARIYYALNKRLLDVVPDDYYIDVDDECYCVMMSKGEYNILVKTFPFGDDEYYAMRCAEELVEKLNEQI